ncbi:hypothetical protein B0H10DRAFT_1949863 [Mycena sp. CBHHK59/15]|nr:hypothetical protein B0H10DRAFT_1949863 [Mycena sp. CBHHK59/15]
MAVPSDAAEDAMADKPMASAESVAEDGSDAGGMSEDDDGLTGNPEEVELQLLSEPSAGKVKQAFREHERKIDADMVTDHNVQMDHHRQSSLCSRSSSRVSTREPSRASSRGSEYSLAPMICARATNLRAEVWKSAIAKVPMHYKLTKLGITPSQVRAIIKILLANQQYIFPFKPQVSGHRVVPPGVQAADEINVTSPYIKRQSFKLNAPFLAPAIADIIHDIYFSSAKSFGYKHAADMVSSRADRPREKELPDPLVSLVATNIWAALSAWKTGVYVPAPEFSQGHLEGTYKSHIQTMQDLRNGNTSKEFYDLMHQLYLKASQSQSEVAVASGSASSIIRLDLADDDD